MRVTPEQKEWRDIPDDPDKGRLCVKHLKSGEKRDIEDKIALYETMLRPDADGNLQREIRVNPAQGDKRYAWICAAVVDWENVFGVDGTPLECTDANKILVARDNDEFGPLVGKFRGELADKVEAAQEAARKNAKS